MRSQRTTSFGLKSIDKPAFHRAQIGPSILAPCVGKTLGDIDCPRAGADRFKLCSELPERSRSLGGEPMDRHDRRPIRHYDRPALSDARQGHLKVLEGALQASEGADEPRRDVPRNTGERNCDFVSIIRDEADGRLAVHVVRIPHDMPFASISDRLGGFPASRAVVQVQEKSGYRRH